MSNDTKAIRSATSMGAGVFLSRILGLVREQMLAILFGAGVAMDAFVIAFRIPNLLRDLFAEGALNSAFVPHFVQAREKKGLPSAWQLTSDIIRALGVITIGLTIVGVLLAPYLVELYASSYHEVPGKFELTVLLTRIIFPFFPFIVLAAILMGALNACGFFQKGGVFGRRW